MSDPLDPTADAIEFDLRSWFKATRTPAAPQALRAFAAQLGSAAKPTAPVRRIAIGWRQASGNRFAATLTAILMVILAGALLIVAGRHEVASPSPPPSASPGPSGPAA